MLPLTIPSVSLFDVSTASIFEQITTIFTSDNFGEYELGRVIMYMYRN